jgi:hypothetical protein
LCAINSTGLALGSSPYNISFASVGVGLTGTDLYNFNRLTYNLQSNLGRIDPNATTFLTAASITDVTQSLAINTLVFDLKAYGIWDKMKAIYPFVGQAGVSSSFQFNLKDISTFKGTFFGGWTFSSTGAKPDGSTGYMDTNLNYNTTIGLNSTHYSFYSRTNNTSAGFNIGCYVGGQENWMSLGYSAGSYYYPNTAGVQVATTNTQGFYLGTFLSNSIKLFKNLISIASKVSSTYNSTNLNVYIGAANTGVATLPSPHECAFASIGDGLTDTEAANFYTAIQKFQTTLGRQV